MPIPHESTKVPSASFLNQSSLDFFPADTVIEGCTLTFCEPFKHSYRQKPSGIDSIGTHTTPPNRPVELHTAIENSNELRYTRKHPGPYGRPSLV